MEYIGNEEYWDENFESREGKLMSPEESLVSNIHHLRQGSVLDIACGDGRNALFLLQRGFDVTGVDFSSKSLERFSMFASRNDFNVGTRKIDLSQPDPFNGLGVFDNALVSHYRLSHENILSLKDHITKGGILFVCGFGHAQRVDNHIGKDDLIQPSDFDGMENYFKLLKYNGREDQRGFIVTYIYRRK